MHREDDARLYHPMTEAFSRLAAALADRYRIEREIGEGGMATVYLAEDLKHDRKVAIKVLKPELAAVVGAERFLAEIRTTANLQHPNILPLFDSGEADGFLFYVMPYVEGESLRDRLDREKQLSVEEALRIAGEAADALDYAHRHGVIHRDVKPANILLHEGRPMIADFGIALAVSVAGGDRLTETGLSVGTPHYMSPEQASGDRALTAASDVYSLACVLYEMLTGEPPHTGATAQAILGKILKGDFTRPSEHRRSIPSNVDAAITRALEWLPADRFSSAAALARALDDPSFRYGTGDPAAAAQTRTGRLLIGVLTVVTLGFAALSAWALTRGERPRPVTRYVMSLPGGLRDDGLGGSSVTVSPDGERIVFVGTADDGRTRQLWLKRRDQLSAEPLPGTLDALTPMFSPDGRRVAFVTPNPFTLKLVTPGESVAVTVAGTLGVSPRGIAWSEDGYIYAGGREGLLRVPEAGGDWELMTAVDTARREHTHNHPRLLPDGRGVLFQRAVTPTEEVRNHDIAVLDLETGETKKLVDGVGGIYLPTGQLAYVSVEGTLIVQPFDLETLELTGSQIATGAHVSIGPFGVVDMALSAGGDLMYRTGVAAGSELVRVSREGTITSIDPDWRADFRSLALSPDGTTLAVEVGGVPSTDVWLKDLTGGTPTRLTNSGEWNARPVWTPDGHSITFVSRRGHDADIWIRRADGGALAEQLLDLDRGIFEALWSPDGAWLLARTNSTDLGGGDVLGLRPDEEGEPTVLIDGPAQQWAPVLSPNGRWLAYQSDETGQFEVYVVPFPNTTQTKWSISSGGGTEAFWAHSGRELFYKNARDDLVSVEVETDGTFSHGRQTVLFSAAGLRPLPGHVGYVPTLDDQAFYWIRAGGAEDMAELVVVENWLVELKRLLGR